MCAQNSAKMGWDAQRAPNIGAERQRSETGGERRGRSARGASGRAPPVPGIVRRPVNGVVALPVAEAEGHIGLAENDGAGRLEAGHGERVFLGHEVLESRHAPGRRQSGDVVGFLDRDGHAEQRHALAARQRLVRFPRRLAGAGEIPHRHGVQVVVERLDPGDEPIGQFECGNLPLLQRFGELARRAIGPLRSGVGHERPLLGKLRQACRAPVFAEIGGFRHPTSGGMTGGRGPAPAEKARYTSCQTASSATASFHSTRRVHRSMPRSAVSARGPRAACAGLTTPRPLLWRMHGGAVRFCRIGCLRYSR